MDASLLLLLLYTYMTNHTVSTYLELDILEQIEVLCIQSQIFQELGVVQEVWKMVRHWKVTKARHFFGGIGDHGVIYACSAFLYLFLEDKIIRAQLDKTKVLSSSTSSFQLRPATHF